MAHSALPPPEELEFETLADIARGGMGVVQMARVVSGRLEGKVVALKRLNPTLEAEPEFVNMFLDETWITAGIDSPHVVRVEAWGRDSLGLFLAVELVQGVSLSRLIKESKAQQEPFAERTVANIVSQVCAGLATAHALRGSDGTPLRLVHRDLTPGNILVGFDGVVKIADFGIAKAEERLTSTRIGMMKGKPAYMAPEQARGGEIDARADLFAVGVVLYELLAGNRPWTGKNDLEMLIAVASSEPVELASIRKVNPVFSDVVRRCLKKNPRERPTTADAIRSALDVWRRDTGFLVDDPQSLAAFVQRNTPEQQAWFRQALGGALAPGGLAYSDVEQRIDASRKGDATSDAKPRAAKTATPAPAAGSSAPPTRRFDASIHSASNSVPPTRRFDVEGHAIGNSAPPTRKDPEPGQTSGTSVPPTERDWPIEDASSSDVSFDESSVDTSAPPRLEEIDDLAATKFLARPGGLAFVDGRATSAPSATEVGTAPTAPKAVAAHRPFGGTIALDEAEHARARARLPGPPPPRPDELPRPPITSGTDPMSPAITPSQVAEAMRLRASGHTPIPPSVSSAGLAMQAFGTGEAASSPPPSFGAPVQRAHAAPTVPASSRVGVPPSTRDVPASGPSQRMSVPTSSALPKRRTGLWVLATLALTAVGLAVVAILRFR